MVRKNPYLLDYKDLSKLVNIALATAKLKELKLPHKEIRPFMHLLLFGRIGSGKSSIMMEIAKKIKAPLPIISLTKATLIGSVDKATGMFSPPAIWESRKSILSVDDFFVGKIGEARDMLRLLLGVMEHPEYRKKIGYRCNDFCEEDGDLYCIVKKNTIFCKTKFVFFANTMMNLYKKMEMIEMDALVSRCLVLPYYPSMEDLIAISKGKKTYIYEDLSKGMKLKVKLNKKEYNAILKFLQKQPEMNEKNYLRTIGDLCRAYAVIGRIDKKIFGLICTCKFQS